MPRRIITNAAAVAAAAAAAAAFVDVTSSSTPGSAARTSIDRDWLRSESGRELCMSGRGRLAVVSGSISR